MRVVLSVPRELSSTSAALGFVDSLPHYVGSAEVILDFRRLRFAAPYPTLLVAHGLRQFVRDRRRIGLETKVDLHGISVGTQSSSASYLGHVGFFRYIGIDFGNLPGAAAGSSTYLPLTVITRQQISAAAVGVVFQSAVTKRCRHLSAMLFPGEAEQDVLEYCFREIVRNVFEHAHADECTLMAQRYGATRVEIAIADAGVGVHATLGPVFGFAEPEQSVRAALEPGVTRVHGEQAGTEWDNSGFGLYVVSKLGVAAGSFTITTSGVCFERSEYTDEMRRTAMTGTAIRLSVNVENAEYFSNQLETIVKRGEQLASADTRVRRPASLSTRSREERR